ncbi:hypothetical protein [uncultured Selenomonas sp.]|uniref:hypothetical protein n=1 Tax=uncultured Selenomonas sp. TaxID=159275 RepID=UPI0028D6B46A|nr:hypothetical protein [uncultured Selenomonas sp.]
MIEHRKTSVTYRGDGNTTVFPFSFAISGADNIRVAIYDTATERTTEISRDYFVDVPAKAVHYPGYAPGQAPAAHVQPPKLPNGKTITIYRKTPINQLTNLGAKYPLPSIEAMSDKAIAILQEHDEMFGRTVTLPAGDPKTPEQRLTDLQNYVSEAKGSAGSAAQSAQQANDAKSAAASSAAAAAGAANTAQQHAMTAEDRRMRAAASETNVRRMEENVANMQRHIDGARTETGRMEQSARESARNAKQSENYAERYAAGAWRAASEVEANLGIRTFEYDEDGDLMPKESPPESLLYELDEDGDIMPRSR